MPESKMAKCLSILGTGSDVGKSIVVTALCRIFSNRGIDVAPYKAQNMSNNSWVTSEGLEMGRAQVVQAQACRLEPSVRMNPVLLKPSTDTGAQVVLHGLPQGTREAKDYFHNTDFLFQEAFKCLNSLRLQHQLVVMEGAGSCAEVNLRSRDFVNFKMAHASDAPVILVGDINKGGIFAQLVGTLEVIPPEDRNRIKGFIINQFRGDASLFQDGRKWIEEKTGLPVLGLIPWFYHIEIDSEDGFPLDTVIDPPAGTVAEKINIAVIRLPHISNFTDFNPLIREENVNLHYLSKVRDLRGYDILLLPGSKNVRADMSWLVSTGWGKTIIKFREEGGNIGGICGGFQILGQEIADPHGIEGSPGNSPGLGILPCKTTLDTSKTLTRVNGRWLTNKQPVDGYEIHMGSTYSQENLDSVVKIETINNENREQLDGYRSTDGRVWGTYLHGLFDSPPFRASFLQELRPDLTDKFPAPDMEKIEEFRERQYNLLAEHFLKNLDMDKLSEIAGF